jgi:hypothetical protein
MKLARSAIFLASICCVVIPIHGHTKRSNASTNKTNASTSQSREAQSASTAVNVVYQQAPTEQGNRPTSNPDGYFARLIAAENLPNLILCFVGIAGVVIGTCTLRAIQKQTEATTKSAIASERSISLQEAQLRQWVDLENWKGGAALVSGDTERRWLEAYFDILNGTDNPLTLEGITINANGQRSDQSFRHFLTPKSKYSSSVIITLTPDQMNTFMAGSGTLVFAILGEIRFTDVLKRNESQPFRFMGIFRYGANVKIENSWV